MLFEKFFLPPLQKLGIDGRPEAGSGRNVLMELEQTIPDNLSQEQEIEIAENLHLFAICMASAFHAQNEIKQNSTDVFWDYNMLHESAFRGALSALCPIFPFCGPSKSK